MSSSPRTTPVILVVDDDPTQRYLCRQVLETAGFAVEEADSGASALEVFASCSPDAILLDVVMPGMDGFATCSRLRAGEAERSTPILMVTGLDDVASIERSYTTGATDFISKPFNWTILVQRIRYMLRANETLHRLQLSERRLAAARDQAEQADEAKTMFMANMSHELRTPLNAIIGFSTLVRSQVFGDLGNPKYLEYIADIETAGVHMRALVEDILTMTRLDSGHYVLAPAAFDLHELALSTMALFRGTEMAADRDVRLADGCGWPVIEADERAVRQMLLNLLSNAVKFSATDQPVAVACRPDPLGNIRLSVTDNGIGMTEAEAALALVPFRQVDGRIARKYEGAGLGLSIVKKLIELHGGSIQIDSRPDVGTCVTLSFPAARVVPASGGA